MTEKAPPNATAHALARILGLSHLPILALLVEDRLGEGPVVRLEYRLTAEELERLNWSADMLDQRDEAPEPGRG